MICRECGKPTKQDELFCSEDCRKSYLDYLNDNDEEGTTP